MSRLEIKGAHCPAACMLFKESILDFSTSLIRLRVDLSPVTQVVSRYSALAWGGENNHELANTRCSRTARGQGRAYLGKIARLSQSKVPRASTADYFKLADYSKLWRRACNVLALSFCSALLPSSAQPSPALQAKLSVKKGILICFPFPKFLKALTGLLEVSGFCRPLYNLKLRS